MLTMSLPWCSEVGQLASYVHPTPSVCEDARSSVLSVSVRKTLIKDHVVSEEEPYQRQS